MCTKGDSVPKEAGERVYVSSMESVADELVRDEEACAADIVVTAEEVRAVSSQGVLSVARECIPD